MAIREALLAEGDFHLTSAEIAGERYLRIAVMAPATDAATIERLLDAIEAAARYLTARSPFVHHRGARCGIIGTAARRERADQPFTVRGIDVQFTSVRRPRGAVRPRAARTGGAAGASPERVGFRAPGAAEAKLAITASAPRTDWGEAGRESAVLSVWLDGRWSQDVVLFAGAERFTYEVALGRVTRGRHRVKVVFDPAKSPPGARGVRVRRLAPSLVPADDLVARHAPILYGRDLPEIPGRYENNATDVPLLAYHTRARRADGTTTIEYTTIWSNEDGGTNTPALMARWGRTTDIEWIYRVVLDARGRIAREEYQAPNHETKPFTGAKEGRHPLLVRPERATTTSSRSPTRRDDGLPLLRRHVARRCPAEQAREAVMDAEPWTYRVIAKELSAGQARARRRARPRRAGSDQRNYLYAEVEKDTAYRAPPAAGHVGRHGARGPADLR